MTNGQRPQGSLMVLVPKMSARRHDKAWRLTLTIMITITSASVAAIRSPNKKTAAQAAVFLFPYHLLSEHLRTLNPVSGTVSVQITARAECLVSSRFTVDHHLLARANNALLTEPCIEDGLVPAAADRLHLLQ